jgi:iron-sulfur cluster repair protein YtfE (RIC family)
MRAGAINYSNRSAVEELYNDLKELREEMHQHATLEETHIHPLLSERVPGGAIELEQDHREMHQRLDHLIAHFETIRTQSPEFEKSRELELEFYRAMNRFNAFYLVHINKEEEIVQPTLRSLCTDKEMRSVFGKILANQTPDQLTQNMRIMLPAMNPDERADMFFAAKSGMPTQAFQSFMKLAEQVLKPDDWLSLKSRLEV